MKNTTKSGFPNYWRVKASAETRRLPQVSVPEQKHFKIFAGGHSFCAHKSLPVFKKKEGRTSSALFW